MAGNGQKTGRGFNIIAWSVEHPYWITAFYLGMLLLVVLAVMYVIPRRMMPYVESPMIGINTMMPGLSAEEMETYITKPVEERMVQVRNVRYIRSSSQDGSSMVSLEFPYGTDMRRTLVDVQALMNVVQADLPVTGANLKPSWVIPIDPLNIPVLTLGVTGDDRWDAIKLRQLADNELINRLKTVPNVYSVSTYGGKKRQLQVIIDRNRLAGYGLSILDIREALDRYNVARPAGTLTSGSREAVVRVDSKITSAGEVMDFPVKALPGGQVVYIRDVGRVEDTFAERRSAYHYVSDGKVRDAVAVNVVQNPDASSPFVIADVQKMVKQLERDYPGLHFEVTYDNAHFVDILFGNLLAELGLAVLLTGLAIFLFLDNWRGSLIALITIPVSLAFTILLMMPLNLSLNSSTLIGLVLAIGRDTDDTVVDIHSVIKHLKMGKSPKDAAIDGITEVRKAVFASVLMTDLALIPLLLTGGIVEEMFVGLVWPIILANTTSFFVEMTLTPILAHRFLRLPDPEKERPWIYRMVIDPFSRFMDRVENRYRGLVGWSLRNRFTMVALTLASIIVGWGFYNFIGSEMMPLADVGQAYGVIETKPGTSFARTEQIVTEIEKMLAAQPEIEKVSTEIGVESGPAYAGTGAVYFTGYAMNLISSASMMITLSDKDDRHRTIWEVIDGVQQQALEKFPDELRRVQIKEMGSDVMASSQAPISVLIYGPDLQILDKLGQELAAKAAQIPGMAQVATDWTLGLPSKEVQIDYEKAREFGLTPEAISDQLYYSLRGGFTSEYFRPENIRQATVLVRYEDDQRRYNNEDLSEVYLTNAEGESVPLKSFAEIEDRQAPTVIVHDGIRRVIGVLGFYRPGGPPSMDLSMAVIQQAVSEMNFPPGYGLEMRGDMTQMMDSFRRLFAGLAVSIILIYMMLVAQFRGWLQPLQMVLSVPLELTGAFFGLWLMGQAFSTVSVMSIILLTGMHITTAILMIDAITRFRDMGLPRDEAITLGAMDRIRPILMTSIATILVMVPVSIFPQTGMDAWSPLGTVTMWGLAAGTLLSLLVVPVMHSLIDDLSRWLNRRLNRSRKPAEGESP